MTEVPERTKARCVPCIENDHVRVWRWEFGPGEHTEWHMHEFDYLVVPLTDGTLGVIAPEGDSSFELRAGQPYFRMAGVEHDVVNVGEGRVVFVEVELKSGEGV